MDLPIFHGRHPCNTQIQMKRMCYWVVRKSITQIWEQQKGGIVWRPRELDTLQLKKTRKLDGTQANPPFGNTNGSTGENTANTDNTTQYRNTEKDNGRVFRGVLNNAETNLLPRFVTHELIAGGFKHHSFKFMSCTDFCYWSTLQSQKEALYPSLRWFLRAFSEIC